MTGSHVVGDGNTVGDDTPDDAAVIAPDAPRASDGGSTGDDPEEAAGKPPRSLWRELPVLVVVALLLAFLIKTFLVQAFYIPSESMENTLLVGDRVLVNKLAYHLGDVHRGDVIVFDGRDSFDAPKADAADDRGPVTRFLSSVAASFGLGPGSESDYIKRVIGVGGDHVVCCDVQGRITVNDIPIDPEDYLFPGDEPSATPFDITVPPGRVWVMGDHRSRSEDSRAHTGRPGGGTVAVDEIIGRAFVRVWPLDRLGTLPRPAAFSAVNSSTSSGAPPTSSDSPAPSGSPPQTTSAPPSG